MPREPFAEDFLARHAKPRIQFGYALVNRSSVLLGEVEEQVVFPLYPIEGLRQVVEGVLWEITDALDERLRERCKILIHPLILARRRRYPAWPFRF